MDWLLERVQKAWELNGVLLYIPKTANHSKHFVDPYTNVCTNYVEGDWSKLKYS